MILDTRVVERKASPPIEDRRGKKKGEGRKRKEERGKRKEEKGKRNEERRKRKEKEEKVAGSVCRHLHNKTRN